ncbi:MAG: PaaI family thioesterase [Sphingobacteriaceae bacterium]
METYNERTKYIRSMIGRRFDDSPSAFMRWLNPLVKDAGYGFLVFEYTVREEWTNPERVLHGGVTAGIIDDIIGATIYGMELANTYTTINNVIDYFATAVSGDVLEARTKVIKRGQQIVHVECTIWLPKKDRIIAKGCSNMMRIDQR